MTGGFHEEDALARQYDRRLLVRLLRYLRPYKAAVAVSFLLIVVMAALDLVGPTMATVLPAGTSRSMWWSTGRSA